MIQMFFAGFPNFPLYHQSLAVLESLSVVHGPVNGEWFVENALLSLEEEPVGWKMAVVHFSEKSVRSLRFHECHRGRG